MRIGRDKWLHFGCCGVVALVLSVVLALFGSGYLVSWSAAVYAGTVCGLGKEYGDRCADGNQWDWEDVYADIAGACVFVALGAWVTLL